MYMNAQYFLLFCVFIYVNCFVLLFSYIYKHNFKNILEQYDDQLSNL